MKEPTNKSIMRAVWININLSIITITFVIMTWFNSLMDRLMMKFLVFLVVGAISSFYIKKWNEKISPLIEEE